MDIKYRAANKSDVPKIAKYIMEASDGLLELLFKDNSANMTVEQIMLYGLNEDGGRDSYEHVIVAEHDSEIISILQYYSSDYHVLDESMKSFLSEGKYLMFTDFYHTKVENSLVVNAMYTVPTYRNKGIGTNLLSHAKSKAISRDYKQLSLYVYAQNTIAQKMYRSNGFIIDKKIALVKKDEIFLMKCDIE